jgi:hypothetical protein
MIISLELVVLNRRGLFASGGLLDWEVLSVINIWTSIGKTGQALRTVYAPGPFRALLLLQVLLAGIILVASAIGAMQWIGWASVLLFVTGLVFAVRSPYGRDGADEMLAFLLFGMMIACLNQDHVVQRIAIGFVCAQLMLSYVVAGVAKLLSPVWTRQGVLAGILGTELYGRHPPVGRWLARNPRADRTIGLAVILIEVGYPLLFLPYRGLAVAILLATCLFHLGTAILMGLNSFFFVFSGAIVLMFWFRMSLY